MVSPRCAAIWFGASAMACYDVDRLVVAEHQPVGVSEHGEIPGGVNRAEAHRPLDELGSLRRPAAQVSVMASVAVASAAFGSISIVHAQPPRRRISSSDRCAKQRLALRQIVVDGARAAGELIGMGQRVLGRCRPVEARIRPIGPGEPNEAHGVVWIESSAAGTAPAPWRCRRSVK